MEKTPGTFSVLRLQTNNFSVWFDVQQLSAGTDWDTQILQGVTGCEVLLLVASEQSRQSASVRREWTTAIGQGKKAIVVLFEYVELSAELHAAITVDFRLSFDASIISLQSVLRGKENPQDQSKVNQRRVVPRPIKIVEWALIAPVWVSIPVVGASATHVAYALDDVSFEQFLVVGQFESRENVHFTK